jgi:pyruvate dehydrogenase E2 component (dihydrolipoamide acetyltransferase)
MLGISLSFDHRIVDGAPAGEFLKALMDTLKTPVLMLI